MSSKNHHDSDLAKPFSLTPDQVAAVQLHELTRLLCDELDERSAINIQEAKGKYGADVVESALTTHSIRRNRHLLLAGFPPTFSALGTFASAMMRSTAIASPAQQCKPAIPRSAPSFSDIDLGGLDAEQTVPRPSGTGTLCPRDHVTALGFALHDRAISLASPEISDARRAEVFATPIPLGRVSCGSAFAWLDVKAPQRAETLRIGITDLLSRYPLKPDDDSAGIFAATLVLGSYLLQLVAASDLTDDARARSPANAKQGNNGKAATETAWKPNANTRKIIACMKKGTTNIAIMDRLGVDVCVSAANLRTIRSRAIAAGLLVANPPLSGPIVQQADQVDGIAEQEAQEKAKAGQPHKAAGRSRNVTARNT